MSLSTGYRRSTMVSTLPNQPLSETHYRRRLTVPLLNFVSALRVAISAFGQGHVGAQRELTPRQLAEITLLAESSLERSWVDATRILYLGDLSPQSGVVDLLACASAWADRHRDLPVNICWAGTGDLHGVLRAQSTPANLTQVFAPSPTADTLAVLTEQCGILTVPNSEFVEFLPIAQAMAAGLPLLGNARWVESRLLVPSAATGWLFDPLSPAEMSGALDAALSTPLARLAEMRRAAQQRVIALCDEWGCTSLRPTPHSVTGE